MLLLAFREAQYKSFIIWLLAYFLMLKSHFFLCTLLSSYSKLSPACQVTHLPRFYKDYSLALPSLGVHLANFPTFFKTQFKWYLLWEAFPDFSTCDSSTPSLLGPKPCLSWVSAPHSRNSLDRLCSPLRVGTRSYLPWEIPHSAKLRVWNLRELSSGLLKEASQCFDYI